MGYIPIYLHFNTKNVFKTTGLAPEFWFQNLDAVALVRCLHAKNLLCQAKNIWESPKNGFHLLFILLFSLWTCVLSIWKGPRSHIAKSHSARCLPSHRRWRMPHQKSTQSVGFCPEIWGHCGEFLWCSIHASNYNIHIYIHISIDILVYNVYIHLYIYILHIYITIYL